MKLWKEFKEFAFKGNVIDLAVGVIIGSAFTAIVNSVVNDLFTPLLSLITGRVDFCVGDGAQALREPPDVAVVAGMGGQTIAGIVERGRDMLKNARLVLQPNVAAPELRARLQAAGFCITDEAIVRDGRRLYIIIAAEAGEMRLTPEEAEVGPVLLRRRPPLLSDYAAFRLRVAGKALQGARRGHGDAAAFEREISIWEAINHGDGTRPS